MLLIPSFKMETAEHIMEAVRHGECLTSLDLTDDPKFKKCLRFVVEGQVYQFTAPPFGLSTAPYVFTRLVKSVASFVHRLGVRVHRYIADWLLRAPDRDRSLIITMWLLRWLEALGFKVNYKKSDLTPEQVKVFLGIVLDLIQFKVFPSEDRIARCLQWIHLFLMSPLKTALN